MGTIFHIAGKDLRLLLRDRAAVFWVLAWPLVFAFFFGSIMGGGGSGVRSGMKIAVVDEDRTAASQAYVKKLEESDALRVQKMDRAAAHDGVRKGELVAYGRRALP